MKRGYINSSTLAVSTAIVFSIPSNVKITRIIVIQPSDSYNLNLSTAIDTPKIGSELIYTTKVGSQTYIHDHNYFGDLKITNVSASDVITYHLIGEEHIT